MKPIKQLIVTAVFWFITTIIVTAIMTMSLGNKEVYKMSGFPEALFMIGFLGSYILLQVCEIWNSMVKKKNQDLGVQDSQGGELC